MKKLFNYFERQKEMNTTFYKVFIKDKEVDIAVLVITLPAALIVGIVYLIVNIVTK